MVGQLGQGGFAVVYEAIDMRLQRRCAIKVVVSTSLAEQQQFEAEASILSTYASRFPFIPDIYDVWSTPPQISMVMEYIDGQTLDASTNTPWRAGDVEAFVHTLL